MLLNTERLTLKKIDNCDKNRLVDLMKDSTIARYLSDVPFPYTETDADNWIERVKIEEFELNIFLANNLIGGLGLTSERDGFYYLGYWLGVEFRGHGYATEAARELIDYFCRKMPTKKIRARAYKNNDESINVLKKIGFQPVGESEIYSKSRKQTVPCMEFALRETLQMF
ncbi:MAG: GCN5 family acetyltransferase [Acidiferrobacteraceae bacterium]|nr:GCN5 family acetyltransferase [Acidiferrobacteraceae bacterium]|tara:strand:- start:12472 stop:12981 length:510 start_codon:yes stop_codon:yes gene_type:complete